MPLQAALRRMAWAGSRLKVISRICVVHAQHLEDALAAAVAGVVAVAAAPAAHESCALAACSAVMPAALISAAGGLSGSLHLGQTTRTRRWAMMAITLEATRNGCDADIDQTCNSAGRIVRVQCAENQVSCQRRLHGDLGRLLIADFADQDDVGGLPQHGPDDAGEVEADLVLHLDLVDAGQVILDRVLGGDDLSIRPVQFVQGGVEGGGLARAGRPRDQEDAVGAFDDLLEAACSRPRRSPGP